MAKQEDVFRAIELAHKSRPDRTFQGVDQGKMALFGVLRYLSKQQQEVSSKDLSEAFGVSSARMTVMLQKLEQRKFIIKKPSSKDARAIVVCLSQQGKDEVERMKEKMFVTMEKVVDEFGIEELEKLFEGLSKIQAILHENAPFNTEEPPCSK